MSKQRFKLVSNGVRVNVQRAVSQAPDGYIVEIKPESRSLEQNAKLWAMLNDVSKQVVYHDKRLSTEDWKSLFTGSLRGFELMSSVNGDGGFVMLGESTSKMNKKRFVELIEMIYAFGVDNSVMWSEKASEAFLEYLDRCSG